VSRQLGISVCDVLRLAGAVFQKSHAFAAGHIQFAVLKCVGNVLILVQQLNLGFQIKVSATRWKPALAAVVGALKKVFLRTGNPIKSA
jgi:hypothetical protein